MATNQQGLRLPSKHQEISNEIKIINNLNDNQNQQQQYNDYNENQVDEFEQESSSLQFLAKNDQQDGGNQDQSIFSQQPNDQQDNINIPSKKRRNIINHKFREKQRQKQKNRGKEENYSSQDKLQQSMNFGRRKQKLAEDEGNSFSSDSIFLYKPELQLPSLTSFTNMFIKLIISAEYINRNNSAMIKNRIYGTDTYTSNSDGVCIGIHYGLFNFNHFLAKKYEGVQITFKVIKPKKNYVGSMRNSVTSLSTKNFNGNAIKPESMKFLQYLPPLPNLQKYASNMKVQLGRNRIRNSPVNINSLVPMPNFHLVFNMNNEPAHKYSIYNIADKGFQKNQFMVRKLDRKVIYFETEKKQKYELSKYIQKKYFQAYRFAKLRHPQKCDNQYFANHSLPLEIGEDVQILESIVEWDQIMLGHNFIKIKDITIQNVVSFKYYPIQNKKI